MSVYRAPADPRPPAPPPKKPWVSRAVVALAFAAFVGTWIHVARSLGAHSPPPLELDVGCRHPVVDDTGDVWFECGEERRSVLSHLRIPSDDSSPWAIVHEGGALAILSRHLVVRRADGSVHRYSDAINDNEQAFGMPLPSFEEGDRRRVLGFHFDGTNAEVVFPVTPRVIAIRSYGPDGLLGIRRVDVPEHTPALFPLSARRALGKWRIIYEANPEYTYELSERGEADISLWKGVEGETTVSLMGEPNLGPYGLYLREGAFYDPLSGLAFIPSQFQLVGERIEPMTRDGARRFGDRWLRVRSDDSQLEVAWDGAPFRTVASDWHAEYFTQVAPALEGELVVVDNRSQVVRLESDLTRIDPPSWGERLKRRLITQPVVIETATIIDDPPASEVESRRRRAAYVVLFGWPLLLLFARIVARVRRRPGRSFLVVASALWLVAALAFASPFLAFARTL